MIERILKKNELGYIQQNAGEVKVKIKCQIVKPKGKKFKCRGRNMK